MTKYLVPESVLNDPPLDVWLPLETPIAVYPRTKAVRAFEFGDAVLLAVEAGQPIEHFSAFDEAIRVKVLGPSPTGTWTYSEQYCFAADCAERMAVGPDHPVILAARRHGEQRAGYHVLQQALDDFLEAPLQDGPASKAILALSSLQTLHLVSVFAAEAIAFGDPKRFAAEKAWQSERLMMYFDGECQMTAPNTPTPS